MASIDNIASWLQARFSRPTDTLLPASIVSAAGEAQARLEERPTLPWFLRASTTVQNGAGVGSIDFSTITGFLRLIETEELYVIDPAAAAGTESARFLKRDDSQQLMISRDLATATSALTYPTTYFYTGTVAYFRPVPFGSTQFTFGVGYYKADPTTPALGQTTLWSRYASALLLAETGLIIAQRLRDKEREAFFMRESGQQYANLIRRNQAVLDSQQDYVMGGD